MSKERDAMLGSIKDTFGKLGVKRIEWAEDDGKVVDAVDLDDKVDAVAGLAGDDDEPAEPTKTAEEIEAEAKALAEKKAKKEALRKERFDAAKKKLADLDDVVEEVEVKIDPEAPKRRRDKEAEFMEEMGKLERRPMSKTALVHDAWSLRRGSELAEDRNKVAKKLEKEGGKGATDEEKKKLETAKLIKMTNEEAADFHSIAFLPQPEFEANPADKDRAAYLDALWRTPEYKELHDKTCRDDIASEIAAVSYTKVYHQYMMRIEEERKRMEEAAEGEGKGKGKGKIKGDGSAGKAAKEAIKDATKEVDDFEETRDAFGHGGDGARPTHADAKAIARLHEKVKKSSKLKEIMKLAGKFRRLAASKQRTKTYHGTDEVMGTTQGDNISRLLPQELMKLADDETLELDTIRRLLEKQTLQRELASVDNVGKGPIIVAIDESGSMGGEKNITAKALGLAMAWIAKKQRRWIALVSYTGGGGVLAKGDYSIVVNKGGEWDADEMAKWLEQFLSGGGSRDLPTMEMPEIYKKLDAPLGKTDLIMVSDCIIAGLPQEEVDKFIAWKKEVKAKVMTIVISGEPGQLAEMSDTVFKVPVLSLKSEAVEAAVSI